MATKKQQQPSIGGRSFKKTGAGFTPISEGEEIRGIFLRMRTIEITDRETRQRKAIKAYDLRLEDGTTATISGRALLDDAFRDIFEAITIEKLINQEISIIRGDDVETPVEGQMMGTYEVIVYDKPSF